jgi:hypothetical protein
LQTNEYVIAGSFFASLLFFACVVGAELRLRFLLRGFAEGALPRLPPLSLSASPREQLAFLGAILFRRHAQHADARVRRTGDVLLTSLCLEAASMLVFAWSLLQAAG